MTDTPKAGHNSVAKEKMERLLQRVENLKGLLQRVENLKGQQAELADDIKDVKAEAKAKGYDMKAFNAMLSLRAKTPEVRQMIGFYADALGVFG